MIDRHDDAVRDAGRTLFVADLARRPVPLHGGGQGAEEGRSRIIGGTAGTEEFVGQCGAMVGDAGTAARADPPFGRFGIARRRLDLGRESVDPTGLMRQQPVEVSTTPVEIALEEAGAAQDGSEEADRPHHQGQQRQSGQPESRLANGCSQARWERPQSLNAAKRSPDAASQFESESWCAAPKFAAAPSTARAIAAARSLP